MHTTGGYLTQVAFTHKYVFDLHPDTDVFWCTADVGWVTGHSYIVYGPLANGATSVMYEGVPELPGQRSAVGDHREVQGHQVLHGAHGDPHVHEVGRRRAGRSTICRRCACSARSASRSTPRRGCGTRSTSAAARCPVVDTWWQTETGGIMISPLPGATTTKPGSATFPLPGIAVEVVDDAGKPVDAWRRLPHAHPSVAGHAARHLGRPAALLRHLLEPLRRPLLRRRRLQARRRRLPVAARARRRRHERQRPPHLDHRGRVGAGLAPDGGRGGGRRGARRHDRAGDHRLRHAARRPATSSIAELRDHVATEIGAIAKPKTIYFTADLPKTRSGKIMRRLLRDVAEGRNLGDTTTLADASVVGDLQRRAAEVATED